MGKEVAIVEQASTVVPRKDPEGALLSEPEQEHLSDSREIESLHADGEPDMTVVDDIEYEDHFSLRSPSSAVRFRDAKVIVYERSCDQTLLQDRIVDAGGGPRRHKITVKRMRTGTFGLRCLRTAYTLVALLLLAFLFVFCFQIILFLFLDIPLSGGATTGGALNAPRLIATILSIPLFLHAMGSIMALASAFCVDTWNGHPLFRSMMDWPVVVVEWLCFFIFLAVPIISICVTLFASYDNWWEVSAMVWMCSVFIFFLVFCLMVVLLELAACLELVKIIMPNGTNTSSGDDKIPWYKAVLHAILLTQTQRFAGTRDERYLIKGNDDTVPKEGYALSPNHTPRQVKCTLYSKLAASRFLSFIFTTLPTPQRRFSVEEMRDIVPFVTNHNWSLEKMFCRNSKLRVVYAVSGEGALSSAQIVSTVACTAIGLLLVTCSVAGFLVWVNQPAAVVLIVAILMFLCCAVPLMRSMMELCRTHATIRQQSKEDGGSLAADTTVYQVWETLTVTEPKPWYCWTRFVLDVGFLFLWPLVSLYGTPRLGTLFLILGIFSFSRIYLDASWVQSKLGSVNDVHLAKDEVEHDEEEVEPAATTWMGNIKSIGRMVSRSEKADAATRALLRKARTSEVIGKISRAASVKRWMWVYGVFALVVLFMLLQAAGTDVTIPEGGRPPIVQVHDFYYEPQPDLSYPTCEMTKGFTIPGVGTSSLPDYSFLAALSYETPNVTQYHLDKYFVKPGSVVDEAEFVAQYRIDSNTVDNPVYFKLFSFPSIPGYGIVSIRGSQTTADFLVDAQLWSSAFLAQVVRAFIPFGWIWTPVLDDLVTAVNFVESESLKRVAYYKVTTGFINDLLENDYTYAGKSFHTLRITGASLGGGLAIISGAQTRANAVAISGLNGALSRHTFEPPLTLEQLNARVFNVIPDRDIIARIGDKSRLFQEIDCKAPANSLLGCHSMWRSVCELAYTCGTNHGSRPVLCRCVQTFGFPEPIRNGTRTFEEACMEEEAILMEDMHE